MGFLTPFLPWIAFAATSGLGWGASATLALVATVALLVHERRRGAPWDALDLDVSSAVFFAVLATLAALSPDSALRPWTGAASFCWLALTTAAGLLVGRPFTLGIARRGVPVEFHGTRGFLRINRIITGVWTAAFAASAAALAAATALSASSAWTVPVHVLGFAVPMAVTVRMRRAGARRVAAARAAAGADAAAAR